MFVPLCGLITGAAVQNKAGLIEGDAHGAEAHTYINHPPILNQYLDNWINDSFPVYFIMLLSEDAKGERWGACSTTPPPCTPPVPHSASLVDLISPDISPAGASDESYLHCTWAGCKVRWKGRRDDTMNITRPVTVGSSTANSAAHQPAASCSGWWAETNPVIWLQLIISIYFVWDEEEGRHGI